MKVRVVVNPKAGAGAAARRIPDIRRALERGGVAYDIAETRGPRDAARIVREAYGEGVTCCAIVGGDGTLNEASQAFLAADGSAQPGPELALIPSGTGGDFRKTFDLGNGLDEAVDRLRTATPRAIDLGVVDLIGPDGRPARHAFINILSFGLGGLADRIVNASPKWLGGKATFLLGTLRATLVYRPQPVVVSVDGEPFLEAPIMNVALANGRFFGGGMKIAPGADPSDGSFDVVALHDLSKLAGVALASKIYAGSHPGSPGVRVTRGRIVEARAVYDRDEVLIDMDGETPGRLPLTARVLPGAVTLRA